MSTSNSTSVRGLDTYKLLTLREICEIVPDIRPTQLAQHVRAGEFECVQVHGRTYVVRASFIDWLRTLPSSWHAPALARLQGRDPAPPGQRFNFDTMGAALRRIEGDRLRQQAAAEPPVQQNHVVLPRRRKGV